MSGAISYQLLKRAPFSQGNVCALYLIFQGYLDIAFIPHGHNVKGNNKNILQRSAFVAKVQRGKYLLGLVANWDPSSILLLDITITIKQIGVLRDTARALKTSDPQHILRQLWIPLVCRQVAVRLLDGPFYEPQLPKVAFLGVKNAVLQPQRPA